MTIARLTAEFGTPRTPSPIANAVLITADDHRRQVDALAVAYQGLAHLIPPPQFGGGEEDTLVLYPEDLRGRPLIAVGLGAASALTPERLRRAAARAVKIAAGLKQEKLVIGMPSAEMLEPARAAFALPVWETVGNALAEGALLASYQYNAYKSTPPPALATIVLRASHHADALRAGIDRATIVCEGTALARDLANAPGNEIHPGSLSAIAKATGRRHGFTVQVLEERRLRALGMGGILGVGQGSQHPPRLLVLHHGRASRRHKTVVLVGKGVTFDSGGISIKPSANMAEMKMDMSGAAAVLGAIQTAARLKLPVHLVGLIPVVENMPGGKALKPGDILRHANGKTSEVDNTDAEGRLILADALVYAARFHPAAVIDLATLTGAVVVALGHHATGMLGNNAALQDALRAAGDRTYERVWPLPMFDEYEKLIKSDIADVKNVGGRWGGAITGAMFLKQFVGGFPWAHLDIAGTAIMEDAGEYTPKGGSGVGVRLLVDFLTHYR